MEIKVNKNNELEGESNKPVPVSSAHLDKPVPPSPLSNLHNKSALQKIIGLLLGVLFGFLLQRGGVANCDVIMGQLLFTDFTVLKVMLSAVITGLFVVNFFDHVGWVELQPKSGGWGLTVPGGLLFGVGFAVLGYCPGTLAAAVGQGSLDALFVGLTGIVAGAWLFAVFYPRMQPILNAGSWNKKTLPELLNINRWTVIVSMAFVLTLILLILEVSGL